MAGGGRLKLVIAAIPIVTSFYLFIKGMDFHEENDYSFKKDLFDMLEGITSSSLALLDNTISHPIFGMCCMAPLLFFVGLGIFLVGED